MRTPLRVLDGVAAVLPRDDVDTDQILPKQFLKGISRTGYGEHLFFDWGKDPAFELNQPEYAGASILVSGRNFGCGSSREHAVWALLGAGFRAVVASSFGDIFRANAVKNGLVPIAVERDDLADLQARCTGGRRTVTVDMDRLELRLDGVTVPFALERFEQHAIVEGLDEVALTLSFESSIADFEDEYEPPFDTRATHEAVR
jgi:3-isopropylmalate/(R)-2-methylmalate dehydratase small subunit